MKSKIEVCTSPALYKYSKLTNCIVAVIDVLRATSCFSAIFDKGATSIIPVEDLEALFKMKQDEYLTAAERGGVKVDFTDFGNSPTQFLKYDFSGKSIAYSTTNGTKAILLAAKSGNQLVTACFNNLDAAVEAIRNSNKDVLLLCSGWQNDISLEDMACAGALINELNSQKHFQLLGDAAYVCEMLWTEKSKEFPKSVQMAEHFIRLKNMGLHEDLDYCFRKNNSVSVPRWNGMELTL